LIKKPNNNLAVFLHFSASDLVANQIGGLGFQCASTTGREARLGMEGIVTARKRSRLETANGAAAAEKRSKGEASLSH
jgi:hypothetical protein